MLERSNPFYRSILWAVLIAAVLRVCWAILVPVVPISDSVAYDTFARMLAEYGVFGWTPDKPFAFWPPGTSFIHGLLYKIFGVSYGPIVAMNILLTLGVLVSCARLADRYFGRHVAVWTAFLIAVWPTLVMYTTVLASEIPFLFFCVAALDAWTSREDRVVLRGVVTGVLLGFASLIRPVALLLPAVYAGAVVLQNGITLPRLRAQFLLGAVAALAMVVVIAPWTWRNYQIYGEPVLISTNGGITFWMGNTPGTDGGYMDIPEELHALPDNEQEKILSSRARQYILDEPGTFALNCLRKLVALYGNESIGVIWNEKGIASSFGDSMVLPLKRFTQVAWMLIFVCVAIGFVASIKELGWRRVVFGPVVLSIAYFSAIYIVTVAQDRYHLSFAGQIGILGGAGLAYLQQRFASRKIALSTSP